MKYVIDNDLHIHSHISLCSSDSEQTNDRILEYAEKEGIKTLCLTNHFWDEAIAGASESYQKQNLEHILAAKPLPQRSGIRFLFGCETELDRFMTLGLAREHFDLFDFIVIPITHMQLLGFTVFDDDVADARARASTWVKRLDAVLSMDLPFHKIGLAHLTCIHIARHSRSEYLETLSLISDEDLVRLFTRAAELGVGIELNSVDMGYDEGEEDTVLRIYRFAKRCGCKFYLASDAHHPSSFKCARERFARAIDALELAESDKFYINLNGF